MMVPGQADPRYTYAQFTIKTQAGLDTTVCADSGCNNTMVDEEWLDLNFPGAARTTHLSQRWSKA
jgi:hypothetical protein